MSLPPDKVEETGQRVASDPNPSKSIVLNQSVLAFANASVKNTSYSQPAGNPLSPKSAEAYLGKTDYNWGLNTKLEANGVTSSIKDHKDPTSSMKEKLKAKGAETDEPTAASIDKNMPIQKAILSADPQLLSSILKNAIPAILSLQTQDSSSSTSGINQAASSSLTTAFCLLFGSIGRSSLPVLETTYQLLKANLSTSQQDIYETSIAQALETTISTTEDPLAILLYSMLVVDLLIPPSTAIETGNELSTTGWPYLISSTDLLLLLTTAIQQAQDTGLSTTLGTNYANLLNSVSSILPTMASFITGTLQSHVPKTTLDPQKMTSSMTEATKVLALARKAYSTAKGIFH